MEPAQRRPVGAPGPSARAAHGLDRRLDLEAAELTEQMAGTQVLLAPVDEERERTHPTSKRCGMVSPTSR